MRLRWIVVVVGAFVLAACSSSPKDDLIDAADAKCHTINERFTSDLAFGGSTSMATLEQRMALIKDLATSVRGLPVPQERRPRFDAWLHALDEHIAELGKFDDMYRHATPASDMVLVMETAVVDETVPPVGTAAKGFGLTDCADVRAWVTFPE